MSGLSPERRPAPGADAPLRIGLVTDYFLPRLGGIEVHIADLARMLQERGHSVSVLTTTPSPDSVGGVAVRRLPGRLAPRFGFSLSPRLDRTLRQEMRRAPYDLLHAHLSVVSPLGWAAIYWAKRRRFPIVATFHSVFDRSAGLFRLADRLTNWAAAPLLLTAVSDVVAGEIRGMTGDRPVTVLPNGLHLADWRVARPPAPEERRDIVACAGMRLARIKRPLALLEAFRRARGTAAARGRQLSLRIAGEGPERAAMEYFIADRGLSGAVTLLGALPREKLRHLYAQSDMFLIASRNEAFGIAALEARVAGLPVIAMKNAGPESFVRHGETGLIAGDDAMFAAHIARLALDDSLRARLAPPDAGLERFAWRHVLDDNIACYRRAIAAAA